MFLNCGSVNKEEENECAWEQKNSNTVSTSRQNSNHFLHATRSEASNVIDDVTHVIHASLNASDFSTHGSKHRHSTSHQPRSF